MTTAWPMNVSELEAAASVASSAGHPLDAHLIAHCENLIGPDAVNRARRRATAIIARAHASGDLQAVAEALDNRHHLTGDDVAAILNRR